MAFTWYDKPQVDALLAQKADSGHLHDDRYPTRAEMQDAIGTGGVGAASIAWVESEAEADALPPGTLAIILAPTGTQTPDTTAPSAPANLRTTNVTQTAITVAWDASSDNVGVTGYRVRIDGGSGITPTGLSHTFSTLTAGTSYTIEAAARDAAGNWSSWATLTVSTEAPSTGDVPAVVHSEYWDLGERNASNVPVATDIPDLTLGQTPTAGNLIYSTWMIDKNQAADATAPSGWTLLDRTANAGVTQVSAYKIADGTETSIRWSPNIATITGGHVVVYAETNLKNATVAERSAVASAANVTTMTADLGTVAGTGVAFASYATDTAWTAWVGGPPTVYGGWTNEVYFRQPIDLTGGPSPHLEKKVFNNEAVEISITANGAADEHSLHVYAFAGNV